MDRNSKILTGCGIGCGTVVVVLIVIGIIGYNFFSDKFEKLGEFEELTTSLQEKYENYDQYYPATNSLVTESQMEIFLEIRDSIYLRRDEFTNAMKELSERIHSNDTSENESFSGVLSIISTGLSTVPEISKFYMYRDRLLTKYNFEIGEYYFYYILSYYVSLKTDLADGPLFPIPGNTHGNDFRFDGRQKHDNEEFINEVRESRADDISAKTNMFMSKIFTNIVEKSAFSNKKIIKEEIDKLREDRYRIPFDDSCPEFIKEFFDKYADKLQTNYVSYLNPLELNPIKSGTEKRRRKNSKGLNFDINLE